MEIKKKLIKSCIWSVAVYGSEIRTLGKNGETVVNAFETWSWRRTLKIKWTDRIRNNEVFQRAKEERLFYVLLTVHLDAILEKDRLDALFLNVFI
jgi:hypothetical protein